jgi:dipeptidyl aminopeptidase/acylaminoacyl peptidase
VKLDESPTDKYPDLPEANVIIATELMYRHWNSWHDYAYNHIFTANYKNNSFEEIIDIMKGERYDASMSPYFDNSEMCWSPDNKYIAYTCKKYNGLEYATNTNSDIYLYELESGETKNISEGMLGYDKYPVFSNDMKHIAWQSMETPGYESDKDRLMVFDFDSGTTENLTRDFDQNVSNLVWSSDNSSIYFISGYHATFQLYQINTVSREITQITSGNHDYHAFKLGNNNVIIGEKMSMQMASEIFKINPDGTETQITFTNQHIYDDIEMGAVEERWVTTTDGKQMLVWVIFPPAFDSTKEYPAILYCQGGPQSAVSQFWSYRWNFQIMAANGYIIVAPNRRGVPSFGQEWNAQISGDYGGQNMEDYLVAIDELKQELYIDENRLGAIGASYGGFSVFWLAGHHNGRFKAFISHCGMFNLESQYAATEEMFFVNHDLGGAYWEKDNAIAQKSYENSPHRFVDKWDTPILIITGGNDFRIPYTESLQAFNAAQLNGVESKLMVFPDESHFVLKPQNAILWQREFKSWLDTYLK